MIQIDKAMYTGFYVDKAMYMGFYTVVYPDVLPNYLVNYILVRNGHMGKMLP